MILKKLSIENMRSYRKEEIVFPKGSILLSGDIGSGKTTVLLAIEFALFGLQPGQKANSLLRTGEENASVTLELNIDGKEVIIERKLKRKGKSINQEYNSITIDDQKYEESVTEIKNRILDLLKYPKEFSKKTNLLYKFTVYTPQEEMKQIILEPGEIRLNTLRYVFGIDKYKRIEENAALLTSKLREKIRINQGILYDLEEEKQRLNEKKENVNVLKENQIKLIEDYEKSKENRLLAENSLEEIIDKINEKKYLENEGSKSNLLITEKKQQIINLENNIERLKLQIEEVENVSFNPDEYLSINGRIKFQEDKESELQSEYIKLISRINTEISKKLEIENFKDKITNLKNCPTCLQEVSAEYKGNILEKTESEMREINKIVSEFGIKKNKILEETEIVKKKKEEFKKRKTEMELIKIRLENLNEKRDRIKEIEAEKQILKSDMEMIKKHIMQIEESIKEYEKYDNIHSQRNIILTNAKKEENNCLIKKTEINKEIQFSEIQIKEYEEKINKKENLKQQTERIRELEYLISEKFINLVLFTEKNVMINLKEEFSKLFSKWFSILVSETLTAKIDDDFSPVVEHQDYELDYSFLSGGERTAIALAYRLALNQVINSILSNIKTSNLVILDEPTDGFSSHQLDKMRDVLNQLKIDQLILVSHEQKMEGFVENIIRFRKDNGITSVEY